MSCEFRHLRGWVVGRRREGLAVPHELSEAGDAATNCLPSGCLEVPSDRSFVVWLRGALVGKLFAPARAGGANTTERFNRKRPRHCLSKRGFL